MPNLPDVSTNRRHHLAYIVAGVSAAFVLTVMCYWPSLSGPFLFDDIPNLELLGERGGLTSADKYVEFISGGQSGPLGRPLSLASFVLDGQTWPTDPRPFRITNLIIHLVNGLLIFLLVRVVFSTVHNRETADKLALLCVVLWLLHPLLVSTTAYIVQRMTQLSCLFTLSGLLCYVHGRAYLPNKPRRGWVWIVAGMGVCGSLALLSKENGILLPFYALVIEFTVLGSIDLARKHKNVLVAMLCMPLLALMVYMTLNWDTMLLAFEFRPFGMQERLLTQPLALLEYLRQIGAPRLSGLGIIHDDFPISTGLLDPIATLMSLLVIAALLILAVWFRKRWPFISLGILWFLVGHSLEAGPFALELYFEHRNYLPLLGPVIALCSLLPLLSPKVRSLLPVLLVFFVVMESFLTWQAATTWGNEQRFMQTALIEHPNSLRAQQHIANNYIIQRQYSEALSTQAKLAAVFPDHASTRISILNLRCILDVLTIEHVDATQKFLERSSYDRQVVAYLSPLISNAADQTCSALGFAEVHALFDALLRSPTIAKSSIVRGAIYYHKGIAYEKTRNLGSAVEQLDLSYSANPEIDIRLQQIVWLLAADKADDAERYLALARQHGEGRYFERNLRKADLNILQQRIAQARSPTK